MRNLLSEFSGMRGFEVTVNSKRVYISKSNVNTISESVDGCTLIQMIGMSRKSMGYPSAVHTEESYEDVVKKFEE
jgi:hypothetical protein